MSMFFLAEPGEASTESLFYWDAGKAANNKSTAVQQACVYRLSPITHVHYCCGRLCPKLWCTARTYKWTSNLFVFCVTDPNNKLKEYSHHICSSLSSWHQRQTSHSVSPSAAHITRFLTHMLNTHSQKWFLVLLKLRKTDSQRKNYDKIPSESMRSCLISERDDRY